MRSISFLPLFIVGAVLCALYLDSSSASTAEAKPSLIANYQSKTVAKGVDENKRSINGSVRIPPQLLRAKRQACRYQEHWTHRCRNNCECGRQRQCSSHGFCHDRRRGGIRG